MNWMRAPAPIAEGVRRVAASQLHQDRSLELFVIDRAGFAVQPVVLRHKVIHNRFDKFAAEAAEVMGDSKIAHQVVRQRRRDHERRQQDQQRRC